MGTGTGAVARKIDRRPAFASAEIYLPKVILVDGGEARATRTNEDGAAAARVWRTRDRPFGHAPVQK